MSVGSITPGSTGIEKATGSVPAVAMTWRATVVPVVSSTRAATATAVDDSVSLPGRSIVPVTAPASAGGSDVATRATSLVGPPVMTGTGSVVW